MKTVRDVMTTDIIRLSPANKVKTAIILMKGHSIGGLPVLEDDQVVGVLDYQDILGKSNDVPVENIMAREFVTIPPFMPVADAADLMAKIGSGRLLVIEDGRLAGVVTRADLLPELGKSVDPITGLPRADSMRDWGIAALRRGFEITVIFIDLDQFGQFNKKYGHITGDKVLKHVANILGQYIEDERDMLCRYAGDEFVIVTTRNSEEAQAFVDVLSEDIRSTQNPELPEPVTGSIGMHGGQRTKERDLVHYEATLDNLINLASKACTLAKSQTVSEALSDGAGAAVVEALVEETPSPAEPMPVPSPQSPGEGDTRERRLRIRGLSLSWGDGSTATAEVELSNGEIVSKNSRSGFALGSNALRLVVEATAGAVSELLPSSGYGVVVDSVNTVQNGVDGDVVLVNVLLITPQNQERACGSCLIRQDVYRAGASALLDAINRHIAKLI